jgi:CheY-like chemotaxis protein
VRVLVVEDDHVQAEQARAALESAFPAIEVQRLATESQFYERLDAIRQSPPDLFLLDVMLRWADPSPEMPPAPADVRRAGFYTAGVRCLSLLLDHPSTRHVPVILWTVLDQGDLAEPLGALDPPPHVVHVRKAEGEVRLVQQVRQLMQRR